ncbi:MAG: ABC transporter substrate-binding protein, partial [Candidatus Tectomicrobia bacterium]|nr:ABC transporter substrate-binding protein [Candidatus Tectomicrobia bacterium]
MKKVIKICSVTMLTLFVLSFVLIPNSAYAEQQAKAKKVKIGWLVATTGVAAGLTPDGIAAAKLAIDKIEKTGGWLGAGAELIIRDDKLNPEIAARGARELIEVDKVDVLMGAYSSSVALAVSEVAKELKFPFICMGGKTDKLTEENFHPYVFRIASTATIEGRGAAEVAAELLKGKKAPKVSVVSWDYEYGHSVWDAFALWIKKLIPDVSIPYEAWTKAGEQEYGPHIEALLGHKPDLVLSLIWAGGIPTFVSQAKGYKFFEKTTMVLGAEGVSTDYMRQIGKEWPEGMWGNTYDVHFLPDTPYHKEWVEDLKAATKTWPPSGAAIESYLPVLFYGRAVQKAKSTEPQAIIKALEDLEIDTPIGKQTMRACDHQANRGQVWGKTKFDPALGFNILTEAKYVPAEKNWKSCE